MYYGDEEKLKWLDIPGDDVAVIKLSEGMRDYRSDTITQMSRLYAAAESTYVGQWNFMGDDYLMTGDIDLIPLSDYWYPELDDKTVWGWDLTGYGHYPICFIGMRASQWREVMNLRGRHVEDLIRRDLDTMPQAKSDDFYKRWFCDQDLITERLKTYNPTIINRGQYPNGYASGRVDRGAWSLDHRQFIDAHLPQQVYHKGREQKFEDMMNLLHLIWPKEDFGWFYDYHMEFKRLTNQL